MATLQGNQDLPLILTEAGRQSFWLGAGEKVDFVATGEDTGGQFAFFDFLLLPTTGPSPHIHRREDEGFYVLDGEVSIQIHDHAITATPGSFFFLEKDHPHAFRNLGATPARLLDISIPSNLEDLFAAIGLPAIDTTPPPPPPLDSELLDTISAISLHYGVEPVDSLFFIAPEYSIQEDGSPILPVTVVRTGSDKGTVSANITLGDGTPTGGTKIPINFADGERVKAVNIPVIDDDLATGNQTINLALTDLTEGLIPALLHDKAVLTVVDNDGGPGNIFSGLQGLYNLPVVQPPQRQSFSFGGGTASVIATGKDTDGQFSLFDVSLPTLTGSQPYIPAQENTAFYILDGDVSFQLGNQNITATRQTFVYLPKNQPYTFSNIGTTSARLLLINTPPTSVPEPSLICGLLGLVVWGAVSQLKNKLKKQKLAR